MVNIADKFVWKITTHVCNCCLIQH